jgi:hypothetical protein
MQPISTNHAVSANANSTQPMSTYHAATHMATLEDTAAVHIGKVNINVYLVHREILNSNDPYIRKSPIYNNPTNHGITSLYTCLFLF